MSMQCLPDPVDLALTDTSTCDLALGRTGQVDCLYCYPEVGITVLDVSDFANASGICSDDGWQLVSGSSCTGSVEDCTPSDGSFNCCDDFSTICVTGVFPDPVLRSLDNGNCGGGHEQWRLYKTYDFSALNNLEVCFEVADQSANYNEGLLVYVRDASNGPEQIFCLNGKVQSGVSNVFYPYCASLPAWANDNAAVTIEFVAHSNNYNDFVYLDNIAVRGWHQWCAPSYADALDEDFSGCPNPIFDGWNGWSVASGSPGSFPACPGFTCSSLGSDAAAEVRNDWMTLERRVDASSLDGDVRLCFTYGDNGAWGSDTNIDVFFDAGSGWKNIWAQSGNFGPNGNCREVCINLSDLDPDANRNPDLGVRIEMASGNSSPVSLYEVRVSGALYCDGDAIGAVQLDTMTDNGDGTYTFDARDVPVEQLTADILCSWDSPPSGQEVETTDTVWYQP
jgi:hypothetical protein